MEVALLCGLPVGIVSWASPRPWFTAVVKATFSIAADGEAVLAREQRPLTHEQPSADDRDALDVACDFAPQKERVDVLLLGHAHAAAPARSIPASIAVGDVRRSFVATSHEPSAAIPLTAAHLAAGVRVGPIAPRSPARRTLAGDQQLDRRGMPVGVLDASFDFGFFNAAPIEQQLDALPNGATLSLAGLLAGAPRREVILPRHRPLAYLMDAASERPITKIGMRCDTLIVDADRAEIALVWRGAFDAAAGIDKPCVLVAYEPVGTRWSNPDVRERFRRAARGQAVFVDMTRAAREAPAPPAPAPVLPEDETATREMARPPLPPRAVTMMVEVPEGYGAPAPAFVQPPAPRDEEVTVTAVMPGGAKPGAAPLPFRAATGAPPIFEPAPPRAAARPQDDGEPTKLIPAGRAPASDALPFHAPAPPIMSAPVPPPMVPAPPIVSAPLPPPIVSAPAAPRAREGQRLLPVEAYAAIKLSLARDPAGTGTILRREGFDRASWKEQERMQVAAIEAEAQKGQSLRAAAMMAALGRP